MQWPALNSGFTIYTFSSYGLGLSPSSSRIRRPLSGRSSLRIHYKLVDHQGVEPCPACVQSMPATRRATRISCWPRTPKAPWPAFPESVRGGGLAVSRRYWVSLMATCWGLLARLACGQSSYASAREASPRAQLIRLARLLRFGPQLCCTDQARVDKDNHNPPQRRLC